MVEYSGMQAGHAVYEVKSGHYHFVVHRQQ